MLAASSFAHAAAGEPDDVNVDGSTSAGGTSLDGASIVSTSTVPTRSGRAPHAIPASASAFVHGGFLRTGQRITTGPSAAPSQTRAATANQTPVQPARRRTSATHA